MAALVDSSVFIAAERGELDLDRFLKQRGDVALAIASITASELLHGVHRLRASQRRPRAEAFVETILARVPVIPFDIVCARTHARVGALLASRGVTIGAHDLLIGSTALARGLDLITRGGRGFSEIPDLTIDLC
jgi:predicted nucleic acid-binding protein